MTIKGTSDIDEYFEDDDIDYYVSPQGPYKDYNTETKSVKCCKECGAPGCECYRFD